jgi:hypothetical protein
LLARGWTSPPASRCRAAALSASSRRSSWPCTLPRRSWTPNRSLRRPRVPKWRPRLSSDSTPQRGPAARLTSVEKNTRRPRPLFGPYAIAPPPTRQTVARDTRGVVDADGDGAAVHRHWVLDYPVFGPDGQTGVETCRISKVGERGFSMTVHVNGKQVAVNTYTVSEDGQTLTDVGGPIGQPHTVVHERQR